MIDKITWSHHKASTLSLICNNRSETITICVEYLLKPYTQLTNCRNQSTRFFNVLCIQKRGTVGRTQYGRGTARRPLSVPGTAGRPPFVPPTSPSFRNVPGKKGSFGDGWGTSHTRPPVPGTSPSPKWGVLGRVRVPGEHSFKMIFAHYIFNMIM